MKYEKTQVAIDCKSRFELNADSFKTGENIYFFRHKDGRIEALSEDYAKKVTERFINFYGRGKKKQELKNLKRRFYSRFPAEKVKEHIVRDAYHLKRIMVPIEGRLREGLGKKVEIWGNNNHFFIRNSAA